MHTNETLTKLSDDEINQIVHDIQFPGGSEYDDFFSALGVNPYCSNPGVIMPIAFENRIGIEWSYKDESGDYWQAGGTNQGKPGPFERFDSINKNPLRAICEVFILMNQDK